MPVGRAIKTGRRERAIKTGRRGRAIKTGRRGRAIKTGRRANNKNKDAGGGGQLNQCCLVRGPGGADVVHHAFEVGCAEV